MASFRILDLFTFLERFSSFMEVPEMGEVKKPENDVTSSSSFIEIGIQDACDDACSICLDAFCDSDPSTVTTCKHEFHLQCILEWCQRSSNCPMCWQSISLKDPSSQELLVAVEHERSFRSIPSRNTTTFRHLAFGNFELQHLPVGMNDPELEERIVQHLAVSASMRRSHHSPRRQGSSSHSSPRALPQFEAPIEYFNVSSDVPFSASTTVIYQSPQELPAMPTIRQGIGYDNRYSSESSSQNIVGAGPSDTQSFSDIWKSRLSSVSIKYKESISKSTREWKEKLLSRSSSMADISCEVRREIDAGIATVSRMIERLSSHDNRDTHNETSSTFSNTTTSVG